MSLINEALRKIQHERSQQPPESQKSRVPDPQQPAGSQQQPVPVPVPVPTPPARGPVRKPSALFFRVFFGILIGGAAFGAAAAFTLFLIQENGKAAQAEAASGTAEVADEVRIRLPEPSQALAPERTVVIQPERISPPVALTEPADFKQAASTMPKAEAAGESTVSAEPEDRVSVPTVAAEPESLASPNQQMEQFIENLEISGVLTAGGEGKILSNGRIYRKGDDISVALGLRIVSIEPKQLTFEDERGQRYIKTL